MASIIAPDEIRAAARAMGERVIRTPMVHSPTLGRMFGGRVFLKLENLQKTGSFKIRGATYKLLKRAGQIPAAGVVAASAGNHAQGVALAAAGAGLPATIVMPEWASISKQEATRAYGGEVILFGGNMDETLDEARRISRAGRAFIHPFDDEDIIAGQGTIGLEIMADLPETDRIIAPIGGGGLISGIATAAKSIRRDVQVIGVQAAVCPSALESLRAGRRVGVPARTSIADGISVKQVGEITFEIIRKLVDEVALVDEEQIASAILMLLERKKVMAEGAGAAPLAALLGGAVKAGNSGTTTVLVISGGNVDSPLLGRILSKGLLKNGRLMRVHVRLSDTPGSLAGLLAEVARAGANVLHIYHDRNVKGMDLYATAVELELETRSAGHIADIAGALGNSGYEIIVD